MNNPLSKTVPPAFAVKSTEQIKSELLGFAPACIEAALDYSQDGEIETALKMLPGMIQFHLPAKAPPLPEKLTDELRLKQDLGIDSLALAEVSFKLDDFFGIAFDSREMVGVETVGDLKKDHSTQARSGMNTDVVITGLGFVTSIGHSRTKVSQSLRSLAHGISAWQPVANVESNVKVGGLLAGFDVDSDKPAAWSWPEEFKLDTSQTRMMPPHGVYALAALQQALAEARLTEQELIDGTTGLFCASAGSPRMLHHHIELLAASNWRRAHPHAVISGAAGTLNFHLAAMLGIRGASCGFVSACSSGSHALGYATDEIRLGRQQRIIVVAAEEFNAETALSFAGMGAMTRQSDPRLASRPFDRARDGFVATGGGAVLVVESAASAVTRGVKPLARVLGWGQSCDGYHVTLPRPDGQGLRDAMRSALRDGVAPGQVDYVNAHAPSTPAGDRAEARALLEVFEGASPAVSSTKALTGHGLSLAGAMEAAFCVVAITDGFIPGQAHLGEPDEDSARLNLPRATLEQRPRIALNNSSGFGGSNVVHVFASADN